MKVFLVISVSFFSVINALPSGIYIANGFVFMGNQYYNPVHVPHTAVDLNVSIAPFEGHQKAVSTGETVIIEAKALLLAKKTSLTPQSITNAFVCALPTT